MSALPLGLVYGEPAEVYHAAPGVTNHRLADFSRPNVPLLFYRKYISKEAPDQMSSDAKEFGEYLHSLALEGETVTDAKFSVLPADAPKRPTEAMINAKKPSEESLARVAWWADWDRATAGKKIITKPEQDLAWKMVKAIRDKPKTRALFDYGKPEVVARHQMASFVIQSRFDWLDERLDAWQRPLIVDLKSIDSLASFPKQFLNYGYWRQAAFYQLTCYEAMKLQGHYPRVRFVVVEKQEPFQCMVFEPDEIALDLGRQAVMADLKRIKVCFDTGIWPGTPDDCQTISVPEWMQVKGIPAE